MIFESKNNTYEVIRLLSEYEKYDTFLGRCEKREYILLRIRDEAVKRSCCRLFLETGGENSFDGLCEIFSEGDDFIFVFYANSIDSTLDELLDDYELSVLGRLELLRKYLAGLLVHEIPVFVACDLFLHGNIGIGEGDTGSGYYTLMELENYESYDIACFGRVLSQKLKEIFSRELKKKQYRELAEYRAYLEKLEKENFLDIYESYTDMYKTLEDRIKKTGKSEEKNSKDNVEKLKKTVQVLKSAFIALLLILAFGVLLWSLKSEKTDNGGIYSYIGDIAIEEYSEDIAR
jgi:uncharacterized protein YdcH (DUF465 family)